MHWNPVIPLVRHRTMQAICASIVLACTIAFSPLAQGQPPEVSLQEKFDSFPQNLLQASDAQTFITSSGRTVYYSTFGDKNGEPILLFTGTDHATASVDLLSPYRRMGKKLGLYFIQPVRTGYGIPYDATMTPQKYADDYAELMTHLGYPEFKIIAMSGGGPYADHFAARHPSRVRSMHLVSAEDTLASNTLFCPTPTPDFWVPYLQFYIDNPQALFDPDSNLLPLRDLQTFTSIPGATDFFATTVTLSADPINHTGSGASHDAYVMCNFPLNMSDFSAATFPTYIYHGELDFLNVPIANAENHAVQYPNVVQFRRYPNDAHLASFRHLGQIFVDLAGMGNKTLLCHENKTKLVDENSAESLLTEGAILDICAWKGTPGE